MIVFFSGLPLMQARIVQGNIIYVDKFYDSSVWSVDCHQISDPLCILVACAHIWLNGVYVLNATLAT